MDEKDSAWLANQKTRARERKFWANASITGIIAVIILVGFGIQLRQTKPVSEVSIAPKKFSQKEIDAITAEAARLADVQRKAQEADVQVERARTTARSKEVTAPTSVDEFSPAQKLSVIDGLDINDSEIAEVFSNLDDMCTEDGEHLADVVVNSVNYVKKNGGQTDNLDIMKGLLNAYSDHPEMIKTCAEGSALLVTLMIPQR
jgi:hypothetical protein